MHRHGRHLGRAALVSALLLFFAAHPAAGFELPAPDHGVEDEFDRLWSKYSQDSPTGSASADEYLTHSSDYVYAEPPGAPDRWNAGEVEEFNGGSANASVHPPGVDLKDGETGIVKDAYVSFFDVSRSTRVVFSPEKEVLYVPPNGEVRGFVDYRVKDADSHSVEVELVENGEKVTGAGGFSLPYEDMSRGDLVRRDPREERLPPDWSPSDETGELTLRANITATREFPGGSVTESVVVNDTISAKPYDPSVPPPVAVYGTYPDNDTALFFIREAPWSSVSLPGGVTVHSNWRFFSARDTDWDTMLNTTADGTRAANETYHPLQVHAYPSRSGIYVDGEGDIQSVLGDEHDPPSLSDGVSFDLPREEYTSTHGFDMRYDKSVGAADVAVNGVVHGTSAERPPFPNLQRIHGTNLTLSVVERTKDSIEVEISLRDDEGRPIDTRGQDGFVRVEGREDVNTGIDGKATVEISPRPSGAVVAEFVPTRWYEAETRYAGDAATVNPEDEYRPFVEAGMLIQLGVFVTPFLLLVYFTDRMLGLGIWPPWRRI